LRVFAVLVTFLLLSSLALLSSARGLTLTNVVDNAGASVSFAVNDSEVSSGDVVLLNSGAILLLKDSGVVCAYNTTQTCTTYSEEVSSCAGLSDCSCTTVPKTCEVEEVYCAERATRSYQCNPRTVFEPCNCKTEKYACTKWSDCAAKECIKTEEYECNCRDESYNAWDACASKKKECRDVEECVREWSDCARRERRCEDVCAGYEWRFGWARAWDSCARRACKRVCVRSERSCERVCVSKRRVRTCFLWWCWDSLVCSAWGERCSSRCVESREVCDCSGGWVNSWLPIKLVCSGTRRECVSACVGGFKQKCSTKQECETKCVGGYVKKKRRVCDTCSRCVEERCVPGEVAGTCEREVCGSCPRTVFDACVEEFCARNATRLVVRDCSVTRCVHEYTKCVNSSVPVGVWFEYDVAFTHAFDNNVFSSERLSNKTCLGLGREWFGVFNESYEVIPNSTGALSLKVVDHVNSRAYYKELGVVLGSGGNASLLFLPATGGDTDFFTTGGATTTTSSGGGGGLGWLPLLGAVAGAGALLLFKRKELSSFVSGVRNGFVSVSERVFKPLKSDSSVNTVWNVGEFKPSPGLAAPGFEPGALEARQAVLPTHETRVHVPSVSFPLNLPRFIESLPERVKKLVFSDDTPSINSLSKEELRLYFEAVLLLASFEHEHEVRIGLKDDKDFVTKYKELINALKDDKTVQGKGALERKKYSLSNEVSDAGKGFVNLAEPSRQRRILSTGILGAVAGFSMTMLGVGLAPISGGASLALSTAGVYLLGASVASTFAQLSDNEKVMNVIAYLYGVDSEEYRRANEAKWSNVFELGGHWVAGIIGGVVGSRLSTAMLNQIRLYQLGQFLKPDMVIKKTSAELNELTNYEMGDAPAAITRNPEITGDPTGQKIAYLEAIDHPNLPKHGKTFRAHEIYGEIAIEKGYAKAPRWITENERYREIFADELTYRIIGKDAVISAGKTDWMTEASKNEFFTSDGKEFKFTKEVYNNILNNIEIPSTYNKIDMNYYPFLIYKNKDELYFINTTQVK